MRNLICLCTLMFLGMRSIAQDTTGTTITHYLFDKFGKGKVFLKDGSANSARQLNNIFPAKKELINRWIKDHHTDFSNNDDLVALIQAIDKN